MSKEFVELYKIENWRDKDIKHKEKGKLLDLSLSIGLLHEKFKLVFKDFDKPVWREVKQELPSYDDWFKSNRYQNECMHTWGHVKCDILRFLTRKELLHRYIEHLADIVGAGKQYSIYYKPKYKKLCVQFVNEWAVDNGIRFETTKGAQRIIDHAHKELKELFGVVE